MNPTPIIIGVIGPWFLNQVPTLPTAPLLLSSHAYEPCYFAARGGGKEVGALRALEFPYPEGRRNTTRFWK